MATIEEIEDLSVEIINGVDNEEDEPKEVKESASSPVRAEDADAAALVLSSAQEVQDLDSDEDDDEDFDETILERIAALSEMFPVCVQNASSKLFFGSISSVKGLYLLARSASWILFSTSAILFAPIIFEVERAQMEDMQKQQQRQILLGPGAAMSGAGPHSMGPGMGMAPPPPR